MSDQLITQAKKALNITVPTYRHEIKGNTVKLWLYGGDGKPVVWKPTTPGIADDFRHIKGVGAKSSRCIIDAGIRTLDQLRQIDEQTLLDTPGLTPTTVTAILKWQKE